MINEEKLKPCPVCGKKNTLNCVTPRDIGDSELIDKSYIAVCCDFREDGCGATSGFREDMKQAIALWNTRKENNNGN